MLKTSWSWNRIKEEATMTKPSRFNPKLVEACQQHLQALVSHTPGVTSAAVASSDGFQVAAVFNREISANKLAAMTSSIHALGEAVVAESLLKKCLNVLIEAESGKVIMLAISHTDHHLLLTVIANENSVLGQLLWAAKNCCDRIGAFDHSA